MNVRAGPDIELIIVTHMRADPALSAATIGTNLPDNLDDVLPFLGVFRVGGTALHPQGWLDRPRLQVDCYAATKQTARDTAAEALASILRAAETTHTGGVISDAVNDLGLLYQPDPDKGTPRYLFGVALTIHPT